MPELIVVGFKQDPYRASSVLNRLTELKQEWVVDLQDAVAVYRNDKGKLRVDQSYQLTAGQEAGLGAFWGVLIGALIAVPFTGGASSAVAAGALAAGAAGGGVLGAAGGALDASWWKDNFGISEDFVTNIGTMVKNGDSAIIALLRTQDPEKAEEAFRGYGGEVLRTNLSKEQTAKLQSALSGREAWLKKAS